jgi:drug/metabolite transporter (DMT)-like permease
MRAGRGSEPFRQGGTSALSRPVTAALLAALCCMLWGSAYPGIKLGYAWFQVGADDTAAKLLFAGLRFVLAGLAVLAFAALSDLRRARIAAKVGDAEIGDEKASDARPGGIPAATRRLSLADLGRLALLGLTQTALQYFFFYVGLSYTSGAKGSVMNSTGVFFSALLAHFFYANDRLSLRKLFGIAIGFVGVIVVNLSPELNLEFSLRGEGFVVIAALVLSAASLYGKRLTTRLDPVLVTGTQLSIGGLALSLAGWLSGGRLAAVSAPALAALAYLACLSSVAFTLWTALLKHNRVSSITVFNFVIPVAGTLLSALFLGESVLDWRYLAALPAVALGVFLVSQGKGRPRG